ICAFSVPASAAAPPPPGCSGAPPALHAVRAVSRAAAASGRVSTAVRPAVGVRGMVSIQVCRGAPEPSGAGTALTVAVRCEEVVSPRCEGRVAGPAWPSIGRYRTERQGVPRVCAHVLIAEDDANQAELVRRYLEHEGHTASVVHDGRAALAEFHR